MSHTDSFIEEVTEEVRRDRMFALLRRWGWVGILAIVLIVGGAAFNEWRKARFLAASQAFGDAIAAALEAPDAKARLEALAAAEPVTPAGRAVRDLLAAEAELAAGRPGDAVSRLEALAADAALPERYRTLARLKAAILAGRLPEKRNDPARLAALEELAAPGAPFRPIALEELAIAKLSAGDREGAIASLRALLDEPGVSQAQSTRVAQLLTSLGAAPEPAGAGAGDAAPSEG
ncbi:MAG: hypothetical protein D6832_01940 [Alphaproteobacteria bacterium]|nr:MAG: hypothetical protein D6832_01940 [Alphaproteobacteria bacterium]